jgi:hypothetical protein
MDKEMNKEMNIIEAYLKEYKQMIIMLIGMPTSNKSNIAKELESDIDLNFTLININDYIEKKFINIEIKNINFKLYDHPDNINYTKLINDVNDKKSNGVILYGNSIDTNKIKDITIDFSYFFDIKPSLLKNNLIKKNKLPFHDEVDNITNVNIIEQKNNHDNKKSLISDNLDNNEDNKVDIKLEIYIKDILIPIYDNIKKNVSFNKFYNIKEDTKFNDIYDNLFDNFIFLLKKKLNQPIETNTKSTDTKSTDTEETDTEETDTEETDTKSTDTDKIDDKETDDDRTDDDGTDDEGTDDEE